MVPDDELTEIGRQAHDGFTEQEMALACLAHLGRLRFTGADPGDEQNMLDLHKLGMVCVQTYAKQAGVSWSGVLSAMQALERAEETFQYLSSLPD